MNYDDLDPWLALAVREATESYPDILRGRSIDVSGKAKGLLKFGRNTNMSSGVRSTIWDTGAANETMVTTNTNPINRISSSSASDTGLARMEAHVDDGSGNLTFVILIVQLAGQTSVNLNTAICIVGQSGWLASGAAGVRRVSRLNRNPLAQAFVGNVWVYQSGQTVTAGVPQDLTKTHIVARGSTGRTKSNKCQTSTSSEDFLFITGATASVNRQNTGFVDFAMEKSPLDGQWEEINLGTASRDSGSVPLDSRPPFLIIPPNHDLRMIGTASANSMQGAASFTGVFGVMR